MKRISCKRFQQTFSWINVNNVLKQTTIGTYNCFSSSIIFYRGSISVRMKPTLKLYFEYVLANYIWKWFGTTESSHRLNYGMSRVLEARPLNCLLSESCVSGERLRKRSSDPWGGANTAIRWQLLANSSTWTGSWQGCNSTYCTKGLLAETIIY